MLLVGGARHVSRSHSCCAALACCAIAERRPGVNAEAQRLLRRGARATAAARHRHAHAPAPLQPACNADPWASLLSASGSGSSMHLCCPPAAPCAWQSEGRPVRWLAPAVDRRSRRRLCRCALLADAHSQLAAAAAAAGASAWAGHALGASAHTCATSVTLRRGGCARLPAAPSVPLDAWALFVLHAPLFASFVPAKGSSATFN